MAELNLERTLSEVETEELDVGQVAEEAAALSGGVHKVVDFVNAEGHFSPEKSAPGVHKVGDKVNELDANETGGERSRGLVPRKSAARDSQVNHQDLGLPARAPCGKMGRPKTMTPQVVEQLCMLLSVGFSRRQAAAYLGFVPSAISNAVARDPELGEELARAEVLSDLQPEMTLMAAARKNWRAAAWYLTFKAKNPRPLSEEEKEERHQARLADERRSTEATAAWMRGFDEAVQQSRAQPTPVPKTVRKSPPKGK